MRLPVPRFSRRRAVLAIGLLAVALFPLAAWLHDHLGTSLPLVVLGYPAGLLVAWWENRS
jgi:hypothetical protein